MELSQEIAAKIHEEVDAAVQKWKAKKKVAQKFNVPTYERYDGTVPVTVGNPFTIEEVTVALENVARDCSATAREYKNREMSCRNIADTNIKLQSEFMELRRENDRLNERIAQLREENTNVKLDNDALKANRDSILEDMIACEDYISQKIKDWN